MVLPWKERRTYLPIVERLILFVSAPVPALKGVSGVVPLKEGRVGDPVG